MVQTYFEWKILSILKYGSKLSKNSVLDTFGPHNNIWEKIMNDRDSFILSIGLCFLRPSSIFYSLFFLDWVLVRD